MVDCSSSAKDRSMNMFDVLDSINDNEGMIEHDIIPSMVSGFNGHLRLGEVCMEPRKLMLLLLK